jgi:microtubule-associated protein tau
VLHSTEFSVLQIESQKVEFKAESKVGSLANVKHRPGGGDIKIFDDKLYLKQKSGGTSSIASSEEGHISGTQVMSLHSMITLTDSEVSDLFFSLFSAES